MAVSDAMEDARIEAVRQILSHAFSIRRTDPTINVSPIVRQTIFYIYEGGEPEKWKEHRPHSAAARACRRAGAGRFPSKDDPMRYDHAIPLARLQRGLEEATASLETMRSFLHRFIQGVVITREENERLDKARLTTALPVGASEHDMLARYRFVGIAFEPADEEILRRASLAW